MGLVQTNNERVGGGGGEGAASETREGFSPL